MSEELLSALLDGECTPSELKQVLDALEKSPALKARWSRMCRTRDMASGTRVLASARSVTANVMAAVNAEEVPVGHPTVVLLRRAELPASSAIKRRARRWQPLVGLAAAASIAAVVVVGGRSLLSHPVDGAAQLATVNAVQPAATQLAAGSSTEPVETRWTQLDADSARQLDDYLMEHSNSRAEAGMGGSLSYARLAVRAADYHPADEQR